jgi:hypothetical protein
MAINRGDFVKALEPGLNALFAKEYNELFPKKTIAPSPSFILGQHDPLRIGWLKVTYEALEDEMWKKW